MFVGEGIRYGGLTVSQSTCIHTMIGTMYSQCKVVASCCELSKALHNFVCIVCTHTELCVYLEKEVKGVAMGHRTQ